MKSLLTDVVGLVGFGCLAGGLNLQFGLGPALITVGALLIALAVAAAMRKGAA